MKLFYGVLCILGVVVPYAVFVPWVAENGLNIPTLTTEILASRLSIFAWSDVILSAVTLFAFIGFDSNRVTVRYRWVPVAGTLLFGVSFGLPLYLLLRDISLDKKLV